MWDEREKKLIVSLSSKIEYWEILDLVEMVKGFNDKDQTHEP